MKLATTIPPRRDGTVIARGATGEAHVFRRGDSGDLECDVTDLDLVASLLSGGLFYPVDPADYDDALRLSGDVGADGDGLALAQFPDHERTEVVIEFIRTAQEYRATADTVGYGKAVRHVYPDGVARFQITEDGMLL